jgi:hypothetical protein
VKHAIFHFYFGHEPNVLGDSAWKYGVIGVPVWSICGPLVWMSQRWIVHGMRRHWRGRHTLCLNCGYDLRETPERCPECGRESARAAV